jgi:DNA ligase-1
MRAFGELFQRLDATRSTNERLAALRDYFAQCPAADGAWAVYMLSGRRMKRLLGSRRLREWLTEDTGLPAWLVEESYQHVGDLAETIALLTADEDQPAPEASLAEWMEQVVLPLKDLDDDQRRECVLHAWRHLPFLYCFLFNKLLTGGLRVGVSRTLVERALAEVTGLPRALIARRLIGDWRPSAAFFRHLFDEESASEQAGQPYPFFLASPLEKSPEELGEVSQWLAEWKWDGIRAQLIKRRAGVWIWSRGEELMAGRFPELEKAARALPDNTVLDGEILAWDQGVLPFSVLQTRIQRKTLTAALQQKAPVVLLAYDLLEHNNRDLRDRPLHERRALLEMLLPTGEGRLKTSPRVPAEDWQKLARLREQAREQGVEGLMLKHRQSPYRAGRKRGDWWKWKVDPLTIDAVLLYAQPGHGRRANLYTDYTLAVPDGDQLVPVAKAYSGLTDKEISSLDRWIRRHTVEKFGPVRAVVPEQVFEIAFEGIQPSSRHKSGLALRFPRIARWRTDKRPDQVDSLSQVRELLHALGS